MSGLIFWVSAGQLVSSGEGMNVAESWLIYLFFFLSYSLEDAPFHYFVVYLERNK